MSDYPGREVFTNAPLAFVACEVRYPFTPRLTSDDSFEALSEHLRDVLPVPSQSPLQTLSLSPAGAAADTEPRFRFTDKARTVSAAVGRSALVIETTHYTEYPKFRDLLAVVLTAVGTVSSPVGVERVGLRYIDEIRVPSAIESVADWRGWIADDVLATLNLAADYAAKEMLTLVRLANGSNDITVRYASLHGTGVVDDGQLRRRQPSADGPFFVIDTDSYWNDGDVGLIDYDPQALLELVDQLHDPVGVLFHRAITDQLRNEFRGTA